MMSASNLENNLDLKKQAAADIFPILLSVERICWSGMAVPLTLVGCVSETPECLHFHLLIHYMVASS